MGYRQTNSAIARTHYQVIWLLSKDKSTQEVAEVTGLGVAASNQKAPDQQ